MRQKLSAHGTIQDSKKWRISQQVEPLFVIFSTPFGSNINLINGEKKLIFQWQKPVV